MTTKRVPKLWSAAALPDIFFTEKLNPIRVATRELERDRYDCYCYDVLDAGNLETRPKLGEIRP